MPEARSKQDGPLLEGKVAVITGAGRGIGREHALLFARLGAAVVVNDRGGAIDGSDAGESAAASVVAEIRAGGGTAIANTDDVSQWAGAEALVQQAIERFGRLDVLVNNAGILRDSYLHNMEESEWDAVIAVHLKGHFCTLRHAAAHWRARTRAGELVSGAVINTASASGTFAPNAGQINYGAAKAAIAALTQVAALELGRYGVRVNAIAPIARTRMSAHVPILGQIVAAPDDKQSFDTFHPRHVSPLVAYLASDHCQLTGKLFAVQGGLIAECEGWSLGPERLTDGDWTIEAIEAVVGDAAREAA